MGIFNLDVGAAAEANVVLDVEAKQRSGFPARLGRDELVES